LENVDSQPDSKQIQEKKVNFFKKEKNQGAAFDAENFDDSQLPLQLKKIIDQLGFLEKKIDTLLDQSRNRQGSRPPFGSGNFSGPRGPFRGNREGFGSPRSGGGFQSRRPEGHRPARPGHFSGRPFQKKHTPHQGNTSHSAN
jgi:hypothetical protein